MLLGFAGRAGVGKTTIARMLVPAGFSIKTFAAPLKESLAVLTGLPIIYFQDIKLKEEVIPEIGKSPRQLMQLMGTEFVREMVYEDFWVWRMKKTLEYEYGNIVIDDCRFENELNMVRELKGTVVHLDRYYGSVTVHNNHQSEQRLRILEGDIVVQSYDGDEEYTFKELQRKIPELKEMEAACGKA